MSDNFNKLMKWCLSREASERPTIEQVIDHPYLRGAENLQQQWVEDYKVFLMSRQILNNEQNHAELYDLRDRINRQIATLKDDIVEIKTQIRAAAAQEEEEKKEPSREDLDEEERKINDNDSNPLDDESLNLLN